MAQRPIRSAPSTNPPARSKVSKPTRGNYKQYRHRRSPPRDRLRVLQPEWTLAKRVLDLGCNDGAIALALAADPDRAPRCLLAIDSDPELVRRGRRAARSAAQAAEVFLTHRQSVWVETGESTDTPVPLSCRLTAIEGLPPARPGRQDLEFPNNLLFRCEDFADPSASCWAESQTYDVILCLSVTKWVHLYGGDDAILRLFRNAYSRLSESGIFVLEPQPWESYKRKKSLNDQVAEHFRSIRLQPGQFQDILLRPQSEGGIGFARCVPLRQLAAKGTAFNRPVLGFFRT